MRKLMDQMGNSFSPDQKTKRKSRKAKTVNCYDLPANMIDEFERDILRQISKRISIVAAKRTAEDFLIDKETLNKTLYDFTRGDDLFNENETYNSDAIYQYKKIAALANEDDDMINRIIVIGSQLIPTALNAITKNITFLIGSYELTKDILLPCQNVESFFYRGDQIYYDVTVNMNAISAAKLEKPCFLTADNKLEHFVLGEQLPLGHKPLCSIRLLYNVSTFKIESIVFIAFIPGIRLNTGELINYSSELSKRELLLLHNVLTAKQERRVIYNCPLFQQLKNKDKDISKNLQYFLDQIKNNLNSLIPKFLCKNYYDYFLFYRLIYYCAQYPQLHDDLRFVLKFIKNIMPEYYAQFPYSIRKLIACIEPGSLIIAVSQQRQVFLKSAKTSVDEAKVDLSEDDCLVMMGPAKGSIQSSE